MTYEKRSDIDELPAHIQRVIVEHDELETKLTALQAFLASDSVLILDATETQLLHMQVRYMQPYLTTLRSRLQHAGA